MTKLLIAEKHSVAKSFADLLGTKHETTTFAKGKIGYYYGADWVVTWCAGHLIALSMPDAYDSKYKRWNLEDLPFIPNNWKSEVGQGEQCKRQVAAIKHIFDEFTIDTIYVATDADKEGEKIGREILEFLKKDKIPARRVWYTNTTAESLQKAVDEAKPLSEYDNLYAAADLRSKLDYIYGLNLTRAYTVYSHTTCNTGRVVSPTVNLIVEKQREIDNFVAQDYAVVAADLKGDKGAFTAKCKFEDPSMLDAAEAMAKELKGHQATITSVEKKQETTKRLLYDLTSLQADASRKFGYTPAETMDICQRLYEKGWQSYPRTNSNNINEEQIDETRPLLHECWEKVYASPKTINPDDFDVMRIVQKKGEGVEASHTGLCPTSQGLSAYQSQIRGDEKMRNIFLLVTCRLLCACLPAYIAEKTKVIADIDGYAYSATGSVPVQSGFLPFEKYVIGALKTKKTRQTSEQELPDMAQGDKFTVTKAKCERKKTQPPKQYTNATLLETMKNIAKMLPEKAMKDILKSQDAGLGTQASRDTIIETMKKSNFVTVERGFFHPTEKAKKLMEILPEDIKSPVMTANMELDLDAIANGNMSKKDFMDGVTDYINAQISKVKSFEPIPDTERYATNKVFVAHACPKCGADVVETDKSYVCKHNCGFIMWRTIAKKKIPQKEFKAILSDGMSTEKLSGFKSKAGKEFECWLYLDDDGTIKFDFSDDGRDAQNNMVTKNLTVQERQ